jgi:hypothetical protein
MAKRGRPAGFKVEYLVDNEMGCIEEVVKGCSFNVFVRFENGRANFYKSAYSYHSAEKKLIEGFKKHQENQKKYDTQNR